MTAYPCHRAPDLFLAPDGERTDSPAYTHRVNAARALCIQCPIMIACRDLGRELHEPGVWGGETDEERAVAGYPTPQTLRNQHSSTHRARRKQVAA